MAMLIQTLSAKLGIATGQSLPEVCRERFSRRTSIVLWIQAEMIAMATDLAEFLGAALGFHLLVGHAALPRRARDRGRRVRVARAAAVRLPAARGGDRRHGRGDRRLLRRRARLREAAVRRRREARRSSLISSGNESVLLAVGILGATVMPHVIYLHSALTQDRIVPREQRRGAPPAAVHAHRRPDRDDARRADQHGDDRDGRERLLPQRPERRRFARGRAQDARADPRQRLEGRCSRSPCSARACRARPSARCPGRS